MPSKYRLLAAGLLLVVVGALIFVFTPLLVSAGLRIWISWKAHSEKLTAKIDKIDAPLFRPVVLRGIQIQSSQDAAVRFELRAARATLALNLQSILLRTRNRAIHGLSVDDLRVETHRNHTGKPLSDSFWSTLQKLIPENFAFERFDLRVENGATVLLFRGISLTANQVESGRFHAAEVVITSPLFRQIFSDLRGATNWQADRLALAGLTLTRGFDVQSITADFSHLGKRRMGLDFDLDTFGGKIRGSISSEWRSQHPNWNMAGSASDISLSQTAETLGFTNRVGGLLHAGKFTFRGDPTDPMRASGSLWAELTGPAWRDREADVIMLGASIYNRQLQLQQLYIKQRKNQLTLAGEASFPTTPAGWLRPDFRGNISALINDLSEFASFFGAPRSDFGGQISIEGTVNARDRKIGGNVTASGASLIMFKNAIDAFDAVVNLNPNELEIEQLELKRKNDVLRASGKVELAAEHNYSGSLDVTASNLSEYISKFCPGVVIKPSSTEIHATVASGVWQAQGVIDPPVSKPVHFTATFPLPFGKDWNWFLNAPVNVTLDFPALFLTEIPRCLAGEYFQNGILSGKLSIGDTPNHPKILGDIQLAEGRLIHASPNLANVSGRVTFNGYHATVDSVAAGNKETGLSFFGDADFGDTHAIAIHLFPRGPIFDLTFGVTDCVRRIETAIAAPDTAPMVGELEVRGGIARPDWRLILREPAFGALLGVLPADFTTREFALCRGTEGSSPALTLGVRLPEPEKKRPRGRKRR